MNKHPVTVTMTLIFLLLNALVWLVFGVIVLTGLHPALPDTPIIRWGMGIASLIIAGIFTGLLISLARRKKAAWYIALSVLAISSLLTIFDNFGWSDLAVLLVNLIPLAMLVRDRDWYLGDKVQSLGG